jgi:hypothetical protein
MIGWFLLRSWAGNRDRPVQGRPVPAQVSGAMLKSVLTFQLNLARSSRRSSKIGKGGLTFPVNLALLATR